MPSGVEDKELKFQIHKPIHSLSSSTAVESSVQISRIQQASQLYIDGRADKTATELHWSFPEEVGRGGGRGGGYKDEEEPPLWPTRRGSHGCEVLAT